MSLSAVRTTAVGIMLAVTFLPFATTTLLAAVLGKPGPKVAMPSISFSH